MRRTLAALSALALLVAGCGAARIRPHQDAPAHPARHTVGRPPRSVLDRLGLRPVARGDLLPGYLLIADRDNNRIIVVSPAHHIVWRFPAPGELAPGQVFDGPDDAFLAAGGRKIVTNEELSDTIAVISLSRHPRILWEYGHQGSPGSAPGYLSHPDDAYLLPSGEIEVADIINCRVLWLGRRKRILRSIGQAGDCVHDPPRSLADPNGDTPLPDGGVLVTEIGGWIDRFARNGRLEWSIRSPTSYPSDAQLLPDGNVLVASYNDPGRIDILTPGGRIVWTYMRASGPGALNMPSLAVMLPNGLIASTDDWNDRVVLINRATRRIVWQYGHTGVPGEAPGYLRKPDGLDLLR
jgi:hypothetical protein